MIASVFFLILIFFGTQALIIREKLAELYESEQQWSKAAQMLSGIDLDSGMRSEISFAFQYFFVHLHFFCLWYETSI